MNEHNLRGMKIIFDEIVCFPHQGAQDTDHGSPTSHGRTPHGGGDWVPLR